MADPEPPPSDSVRPGQRVSWVVEAGWSMLFPGTSRVHRAARHEVLGGCLLAGTIAADVLILRGRMAARAAVIALGLLWAFDLLGGAVAVYRFNHHRIPGRWSQLSQGIGALVVAALVGIDLAPRMPEMQPISVEEELSSIEEDVEELWKGLREPPQRPCNPLRERCLESATVPGANEVQGW